MTNIALFSGADWRLGCCALVYKTNDKMLVL